MSVVLPEPESPDERALDTSLDDIADRPTAPYCEFGFKVKSFPPEVLSN